MTMIMTVGGRNDDDDDDGDDDGSHTTKLLPGNLNQDRGYYP